MAGAHRDGLPEGLALGGRRFASALGPHHLGMGGQPTHREIAPQRQGSREQGGQRPDRVHDPHVLAMAEREDVGKDDQTAERG